MLNSWAGRSTSQTVSSLTSDTLAGVVRKLGAAGTPGPNACTSLSSTEAALCVTDWTSSGRLRVSADQVEAACLRNHILPFLPFSWLKQSEAPRLKQKGLGPYLMMGGVSKALGSYFPTTF